MLKLAAEGLAGIRHVLCAGAHSDDIEIGCGGALLTLLDRIPDLHVTWVVLSASEERAREARLSAERLLSAAIAPDVRIGTFRERYFPFIGWELKSYFDSLSAEVSPDLIFSPRREDRHQDHRVPAELTEAAFRDHLILQYEIPKYDGDLATPNVYIELSQETLDRKIEILMTAFLSQTGRFWFNEETFRGLARIRGIEARSTNGYAEGFHCRKRVIA